MSIFFRKKLVEIDQNPCIKISLDLAKVTIPSRKNVYRIFGREGYALLDLLTGSHEQQPKILDKILCRHPFEESKRCFATPSRIECLLQIWWQDGKVKDNPRSNIFFLLIFNFLVCFSFLFQKTFVQFHISI